MVGLLSSSTDPVARAVDKQIYGDDVGRLIKTNRLYFISIYVSVLIVVINFEPYSNICYGYRIYLNKSRAHINTWARINAGIQHSKVNRRLYKIRKGLM